MRALDPWCSPLAIALALSGAARAQITQRASLGPGGVQGNADCVDTSISGDGRYVVFRCLAGNLVPGDTNGQPDTVVADRVTGALEIASISTAGVASNGDNTVASISSNGRFVVFQSTATNLVAGDTNGYRDIFVRDRIAGTTERASVSTSGVEGNADSRYPAISATGRFVAFQSLASNLGGVNNGWHDVFVRDTQSGTTEIVSLSLSGGSSDGPSLNPSISADGRYVAFHSTAQNLVASDTNGVADIFVRDRNTGSTQLVSVVTGGGQANDISDYASISGDGRFVAFESRATNFVPDTNSAYDIYVHDRVSGTTVRASESSAGVQATSECRYPAISSDGRCVAFWSGSSALVMGDTNGCVDIFVRDLQLNTTDRVSLSIAGAQTNSSCHSPSISADGRCVAFQTSASNLVPGDTNNNVDVYVRERAPAPPQTYCTAGTTTNGCSAVISVSGAPSSSFATACTISVANAEGLKSGILFYGVDNTAFAPLQWGSGGTSFLCVKHPLQRTPVQNSGGTFAACNGSYVLDWNAYQLAHPLALGNPWHLGDKVYVQAWFRDPPAVKSTGLSNALEMTYIP